MTVVDQLLQKRSSFDPGYWEDLVKSVTAVVYEGEKHLSLGYPLLMHKLAGADTV